MFKTKIMVPALYTTGLTLVGFFLALSAAIYAKKSCYTTVSCVSQDWSVVGSQYWCWSVLLEESDLQPQYLDYSIRQLQTKKIEYGNLLPYLYLKTTRGKY